MTTLPDLHRAHGGLMSYTDAIAIRVRHLNGRAVPPDDLDEAIRVIQTTKPWVRRKPKVLVDMGSAALEIPRFVQVGAPKP